MQKDAVHANGFSLVEMMIVIAILAILAAVAIPAYLNHTLRVRQADAFNNLLDVKAGQEMYYSMNDRYATSMTTTNFGSLLSFDYADTTYYIYSIPSTATSSFTARAIGNTPQLTGDCLVITNLASEPSTCGTPAGFKFSLIPF